VSRKARSRARVPASADSIDSLSVKTVLLLIVARLLAAFAQQLPGGFAVGESDREPVTSDDLVSVSAPQSRNVANQELEARKKTLEEVLIRNLVNGIFLNGALPAAVFEKVIEEELSFIRNTRPPTPVGASQGCGSAATPFAAPVGAAQARGAAR
jgi:hypothetical protein